MVSSSFFEYLILTILSQEREVISSSEERNNLRKLATRFAPFRPPTSDESDGDVLNSYLLTDWGFQAQCQAQTQTQSLAQTLDQTTLLCCSRQCWRREEKAPRYPHSRRCLRVSARSSQTVVLLPRRRGCGGRPTGLVLSSMSSTSATDGPRRPPRALPSPPHPHRRRFSRRLLLPDRAEPQVGVLGVLGVLWVTRVRT